MPTNASEWITSKQASIKRFSNLWIPLPADDFRLQIATSAEERVAP